MSESSDVISWKRHSVKDLRRRFESAERKYEAAVRSSIQRSSSVNYLGSASSLYDSNTSETYNSKRYGWRSDNTFKEYQNSYRSASTGRDPSSHYSTHKSTSDVYTSNYYLPLNSHLTSSNTDLLNGTTRHRSNSEHSHSGSSCASRTALEITGSERALDVTSPSYYNLKYGAVDEKYKLTEFRYTGSSRRNSFTDHAGKSNGERRGSEEKANMSSSSLNINYDSFYRANDSLLPYELQLEETPKGESLTNGIYSHEDYVDINVVNNRLAKGYTKFESQIEIDVKSNTDGIVAKKDLETKSSTTTGGTEQRKDNGMDPDSLNSSPIKSIATTVGSNTKTKTKNHKSKCSPKSEQSQVTVSSISKKKNRKPIFQTDFLTQFWESRLTGASIKKADKQGKQQVVQIQLVANNKNLTKSKSRSRSSSVSSKASSKHSSRSSTRFTKLKKNKKNRLLRPEDNFYLADKSQILIQVGEEVNQTGNKKVELELMNNKNTNKKELFDELKGRRKELFTVINKAIDRSNNKDSSVKQSGIPISNPISLPNYKLTQDLTLIKRHPNDDEIFPIIFLGKEDVPESKEPKQLEVQPLKSPSAKMRLTSKEQPAQLNIRVDPMKKRVVKRYGYDYNGRRIVLDTEKGEAIQERYISEYNIDENMRAASAADVNKYSPRYVASHLGCCSKRGRSTERRGHDRDAHYYHNDHQHHHHHRPSTTHHNERFSRPLSRSGALGADQQNTRRTKSADTRKPKWNPSPRSHSRADSSVSAERGALSRSPRSRSRESFEYPPAITGSRIDTGLRATSTPNLSRNQATINSSRKHNGEKEKLQKAVVEGMFALAEKKYGKKRPVHEKADKQDAMADFELYLRSIRAKVKTAEDKLNAIMKQKKDMDAKVAAAEKEHADKKKVVDDAEKEKDAAEKESRDPVLPKDFIIPKKLGASKAGLGALVMKASAGAWEDKFAAMRSKKQSGGKNPAWTQKKDKTSALLGVGTKKRDRSAKGTADFGAALKPKKKEGE